MCFFSLPTFPQEELNQAYKCVTNALHYLLSCLKDRKVHKYLEHLNQCKLRKLKKEMNKGEQIRNVLQDAMIRGNPREYQRVLFEVVKLSNAIIHLGTCFGKALVALMCIQHFSSSFGKGKQTLFLVPSVALAIQQSIKLCANLPKYDVQTACYTSANSDSTQKALVCSHIIVATHGVVSVLTLFCVFPLKAVILMQVPDLSYFRLNDALC